MYGDIKCISLIVRTVSNAPAIGYIDTERPRALSPGSSWNTISVSENFIS